MDEATLTAEILGGLEDRATIADEMGEMFACVTPAVLRALIDAARRLATLQRSIACEPQVRPGAWYAPPIARALEASLAESNRQLVARTWGAGPGTTPLPDHDD